MLNVSTADIPAHRSGRANKKTTVFVVRRKSDDNNGKRITRMKVRRSSKAKLAWIVSAGLVLAVAWHTDDVRTALAVWFAWVLLGWYFADAFPEIKN